MTVAGERIRQTLEVVAWGGYLMLVAWIAFIPGAFSSTKWLFFNVVFYAYLAGLALHFSCGGRLNARALNAAIIPIGVLALSVIWLLLQAYLPVANAFYESLFGSNSPAAWFEPETELSIVPEKTRVLMLSYLFNLMLFIVTLTLLDTRRRLKQLLLVLALVGFVHASIGVVAKYLNIFLVDKSQLDGHFDAARGLFINRNHFASFVGLCLSGALAFQLRNLMRAREFRLSAVLSSQFLNLGNFFPVALFFSALAIVLSQSRGAFAGVFISLTIIVGFYGAFRKGFFKSKRSLLPIATVFVFTLVYFGQDLVLRFLQGGLSVGERLSQWQVTWLAIKEQPLVGYGGGSYATVFQIFRGYEDFRQVIFDQSHNLYLHLWLEQGLIGLALWLAFLIYALKSAVNSLGKTASTLVRASLLSCLVVLGSALIQAMFDFNLQIMTIRAYFFVIIAMLFAAPRVKQQGATQKRYSEPDSSQQAASQLS